MNDNNLTFSKSQNEYENKNNICIGGYEEDLVINKNYLLSLDNIYKCSICDKIMINPVECEKCGHNFCYNCINSSDCPFGCKDKNIKESSLAIKNLLSRLRFKCPNKGCTVSFEYSKIDKHNNECIFKPMECPNKNCGKIILRKDLSNHINNECEFLLVKCKYCKYEFIKSEIEHHENICKLLNSQRDTLNYDNRNIGVNEHLRRLSKNLNEIIKNNQKLVEYSEKHNANENQNDNNNYRISIRKSIVPGLEGDEFLDIINKEIENKIKSYYTDFNNNFIKIIKEIDDIKEILKHYLNNIIIDNNFNKNDNKSNSEILGKNENEYKQKKENEEEIKKYLNELIEKTENNLKNLIKNYNNKFSNEFSSINTILYENQNDNLENINLNEKDKQINNKDMYSIINSLVNNLKGYIFETNKKIKLLISNFHNNLNELIKDKNNEQDVKKEEINGNENISFEEEKNKLLKGIEEKLKSSSSTKNIIDNINIDKEIIKRNLENEDINNNEIKNEVNSLNNQFENVNNTLNNIKNNVKQAINLINEKFTDFSELVKNNSKNTQYEIIEKLSYEICPIITFSIYKKDNNKEVISQNNEFPSFNSEGVANSNNIVNPLVILKNLESQISLLESNSKDFSLKIKEKVNSDLSKQLNEINIHIEKEIDEKIEKMFSLKYCKECEKIDYFYGFTKCSLCNEVSCKQCIVICIICKNFCCAKCCFCKKCEKLICENCKILCNSCNIKYCQFCIMNCPLCNLNVCSNCLKQCSLCNKNICKINCSKTCNICSKIWCLNCLKKINYEKCYLCNNITCEKCYYKCKEHDKIICQNCFGKCNSCKNDFCIKYIIECEDCKNKYCLKCGKNFEDNNFCKLCKNIYCNNCSVNHKNQKCISCLKPICNKCSNKCVNCSNNICKECSNLCNCCKSFSCSKCLNECMCGNERFCNKCLQNKETLILHECVYFLNNCAITESKKTRSQKQVPNNIEAKFSVYMNDLSDKSFLLVGLTDNNNFEENDSNVIKNIFAVNINNGDKFCSEIGFEDFLDFENIKKGYNDVYIMIKEHKLFFKINDSIYKWGYELKSDANYWFYLENNISNSTSKFLYIRKIK